MSAIDESARMMRAVEELRRRTRKLVQANPALRESKEWQDVCAAIRSVGMSARSVDDALGPREPAEEPDPDEAMEEARTVQWSSR